MRLHCVACCVLFPVTVSYTLRLAAFVSNVMIFFIFIMMFCFYERMRASVLLGTCLYVRV